MSYALSDTVDQRRRIYRGLRRRNVFVGLLRLAVPGIGLGVFGFLAVQVVVANLSEGFSIGTISIENDRVVVQTPSYSGISGDGSRYEVTGASAEAPLGSPDAITLIEAKVVIDGATGVQTTAEAPKADLQTTAQTVHVEGVTDVANTAGLVGTVAGMDIDFPTQVMTATGNVDVLFPGGERLQAKSMRHEGDTKTWRFTGVTLNLPGTPGEEGE